MTDPDPPDDVARAYDRWAAVYDVDRNATRDLDADVLRTAGLDIDDREVLEIGCGTGKNTTFLAAHARRVTAMDFSSGMLARARSAVDALGLGDRVAFIRHDVRHAWPIEPASVDVVVANLILEHVDALEPVFREVARVLRRGGVGVFCELHPARQEQGSQAQFTDPSTNARVLVPAFTHTERDYANAIAAARLELIQIREWTEDEAPADALPRLLSIAVRAP